MSATTWIPNREITVTPAALVHFREQLRKQPESIGVHFGVRKSGCSGWMYVLELVTENPTDCHPFKVADDLTVFVDQASLPVVNGTQIDLVKQGLNNQLSFRNPNTDASCGCGESFSVKIETPA